MLLHQENQNAAIGREELVGTKIARLGRKINTDWIDGRTRQIKCFLMGLDPRKDFLSCRQIVRTGHRMTRSVPEIRSGHDLGHREIHHRLTGINFLVTIPRIVQNPGRFILSKRALGKGAERMHADLISKPVQRIARRGHVVAVAELILVRDGVHHAVQAVNVCANSNGFFFDARINLRNGFDLRIDRFRTAVDLTQKICERLNSELNPLAKRRVRKISQLQVVLRVEPGLLLERRNRIVVKARPGIFPSVEMRHPIRDVDIDSVNACGRDLPHPLHISLPPLGGVRTDPDVLVAGANPEGRSPAENRGLACNFALQPIGMILRQRVSGLIAVRGDAFGTGDVNEGVVSSLMCRFRHVMNRLQLFFWLEEAFVAPRDIVVDFNAEYPARLGLIDNLLRVAALQAVGPNAGIVSPVLFIRDWRRRNAQRKRRYKDDYKKVVSFHQNRFLGMNFHYRSLIFRLESFKTSWSARHRRSRRSLPDRPLIAASNCRLHSVSAGMPNAPDVVVPSLRSPPSEAAPSSSFLWARQTSPAELSRATDNRRPGSPPQSPFRLRSSPKRAALQELPRFRHWQNRQSIPDIHSLRRSIPMRAGRDSRSAVPVRRWLQETDGSNSKCDRPESGASSTKRSSMRPRRARDKKRCRYKSRPHRASDSSAIRPTFRPLRLHQSRAGDCSTLRSVRSR